MVGSGVSIEGDRLPSSHPGVAKGDSVPTVLLVKTFWVQAIFDEFPTCASKALMFFLNFLRHGIDAVCIPVHQKRAKRHVDRSTLDNTSPQKRAMPLQANSHMDNFVMEGMGREDGGKEADSNVSFSGTSKTKTQTTRTCRGSHS